MSVGNQATEATVNQALTGYALQLRDLMRAIGNLSTWCNGQGNGLATLEAAGYSGTANPANPGGVSDAQLALNLISYLSTLAGVYLGTATQGSEFDFDEELSQLWGAQ